MGSTRTQNPYTGEKGEEIKNWSEDEIKHAVDNSWEAFQKYKKTDLDTKVELLKKVASLLRENKEEYAKLITQEMGKTITESKGEIDRCADYCEYYCEHASDFVKDDKIKSPADESYVTYQPIGPLMLVHPWNFPFWLPFKTVIPQLLVGNTVLVKNASINPKCGEALQKLFEKAGFEEGVYQFAPIASGDLETAIAHKYCRGASLTGSTSAGKSFAEI